MDRVVCTERVRGDGVQEKSGVQATDDIFEHDRTVKGGQDFLLQSIPALPDQV